MKSRVDRTGWLVAVAAFSLVLPSCAFRVKVREEWSDRSPKPIELTEASRVWDTIRKGGSPDKDGLAAYNKAVRRSVVQIGDNWATSKEELAALRTSEGEVYLRVNSVNVDAVESLEEIVPADFLKIRRGFRSESAVEGLGASLLVKQAPTEADAMIPATGLWYPITAILNLDQPTKPVLALLDPTKRGTIQFSGRDFPLSANYTAALARDLNDRQFQFERLSGLFSFEKFADRIGLYRASAFDPAKRPCVFVHGVKSSPTTWNETINRLYGVEAIRERYEFWHFGYPTGASIPYMASRLRESIREMVEFRRSQGAPDAPITLIGHSMGGLLAKGVTVSSGEAEWNQLFTVPLDELPMSEQGREILRKMIYFEPVEEVERVIFCATPHRGSKLAENPAAKLLVDLIDVPTYLTQLSTGIIHYGSDALTPLGLEFTRDRITSIEQLSPKAQITTEFLNKPLNPEVSYHSIIGNRSPPRVPVEESSDGVVAYSSSHLDGVDSELVIPGSEHGVHRNDAGIAEIVRILLLP